MTKEELFQKGITNINKWLDANPAIPRIQINAVPKGSWRFAHTCAYYRHRQIYICVEKCAQPAGSQPSRAWSWPGYVIDRTPYGVLAHELGHHIDECNGCHTGVYSGPWRAETSEPAITGYAPNAAEWFAEIFRLYVTNPNLLRAIRPLTHAKLAARFTSPNADASWRTLLASAPPRILAAAENKIRPYALPSK